MYSKHRKKIGQRLQTNKRVISFVCIKEKAKKSTCIKSQNMKNYNSCKEKTISYTYHMMQALEVQGA